MKSYKTVLKSAESSFIEKKSEFISRISPVGTQQEALDFILKTRESHKKSSHNCYGYIIRGGVERYSDDGEPSGTAGMPILEVLRSHGLFDLVCVVTRYYGGIHLGAGGLTRAYTKAAADSVKSAQVITMKSAQEVRVVADYKLYEQTRAELLKAGAVILTESFAEAIEIIAVLPENSEIGEVIQKRYYNFVEK